MLLPGFLLIIVGLVIAGPWLTMAAAQVMARRTSRPDTLIAARRIADDPKAAFRSVSGLVLALLVTTVAVVAITTQDAKDLTRFGSAAETNVVTDQLAGQSTDIGPIGGSRASSGAGPAAPAAALAARLRGIDGVQGVLVVRAVGGLNIPGTVLHNIPYPGASPQPTPAGWSRAHSSRPCPRSAAARPGRWWRRSRQTGSKARCSIWTQPRSLAGGARADRAVGHPRGGRHQRSDERLGQGGRTDQNGAGDRIRLSRHEHAVHHR